MPIEGLNQWRALGAAGAAALALIACSDEGNVGRTGMVVAQVNGYDITLGDLGHEISKIHAADGAAAATAQAALDRLVDQQLLAQEAVETGLDRDPQVRHSLEQARQRILGDAYVSHNLAVSKPGAAEIRRFYDEHPALFRERRVYAFRTFVLGQPQVPQELRGKLEAVESGATVAALLKTVDLPFREMEIVRSAEQLPLETLPKIAALPRGGITMMQENGVMTLMQLVDFVERPVAFEQASGDIERYLLNAAQQKLTGQKVADLRATAQITYAGARQNRQEDGKAAGAPGIETAALPGSRRAADSAGK